MVRLYKETKLGHGGQGWSAKTRRPKKAIKNRVGQVKRRPREAVEVRVGQVRQGYHERP